MAPDPHSEYARIAARLNKQRESILARWRVAVDGDPKVSALASLARAQFVDHIPRILDAFERALRARHVGDERVAESEQRAGAADHGENRWLHGYNSRETMREWGHLHLCMLDELESFALQRPKVAAEALSGARFLLTRLFVDCMVESASSHAALERAEAASRLDELERAHKELRALDSERTELWREAAHDLRGTVGAVKLAATALGRVAMPSSGKAATTSQLPEFVGRVRRSVESLEVLLSDLIELTRLEAGREHREVVAFDAAGIITALCDSLQPLATERHLFLRCHTPPELRVQGDVVKVTRVAQNLILNAIKYTESGGVLVSCAAAPPGDVERWILCVQDTGVGLERTSDTPLAQVISDATRESQAISGQAEQMPAELSSAAAPASPSEQAHSSGEGIGLSIVKRLCELLDASIELQTQRGRGTTFRIVFPTHYSG
jgi:signal transduction histidine kinase